MEAFEFPAGAVGVAIVEAIYLLPTLVAALRDRAIMRWYCFGYLAA